MKRFRSAKETLQERNEKKLTENITWYRDTDDQTEEEENMKRKKEKEASWKGWRKVNMKRKRKQISEIEIDGKTKVMSVLFIQHTEKSELAKRLREKLETLEKVGRMKFKIVEKTGNKLEDLLHRSNAWGDSDCNREDCIMCRTAGDCEKKGQCKKRNVIYETFCLKCEEEKEREKENEDIRLSTTEGIKGTQSETIKEEKRNTKKRKRNDTDNLEKRPPQDVQKKEREKKEKRKDYIVKYVRETGRSGYERGQEHSRDFENCEETSHMLKHYLIYHKNMKRNEMRFGMRLRSSFRSPLDRQVGEAIAIDRESRKGTVIMNSKSEYNRCTIARINTKSNKDFREENEREEEKERKLKEEMKMIKKKKEREK